MMVRWLLLAALLALLTASGHAAPRAYACHPDRLSDTLVNLDGDRAKEEVIALDSHDCGHKKFSAHVHIRDRCNGEWRTYDLESAGDILQRFRIANADGRTKRPEVFFLTRRLAPVARGISKVVRLDDRRSRCPRVRALFSYSPTNPALQSFDVELKDVAPQFRGLEVVLTEVGEVAQRVTTYRYSRVLDRYVVYG